MGTLEERMRDYERYREVVLALLPAIQLDSSRAGLVDEVLSTASRIHDRLEELRPKRPREDHSDKFSDKRYSSAIR